MGIKKKENMLIAVINESTLVKDEDVHIMTLAIQKQLNLHVAPAWNQKSPVVRFYSDKAKVPGHAWIINILDNPDVADALGYHDMNPNVKGGQVTAYIFASPVLNNGGVVLYDESNPQNTSIASVLSHEAIEAFGDRYATFWADTNEQDTEYALELCDACEEFSYLIEITSAGTTYKVSVSDFLFPAWFNMLATKEYNMPFDYLRKLTAPFSMTAGGYVILKKLGVESQAFGAEMPLWKIELKKSGFSRLSKRATITAATPATPEVIIKSDK